MNKRISLGILVLCLSLGLSAAELKAKDIVQEAARQASVEASVDYLKKQAASVTVPSEKRSVYIFLATVQEQLLLYEDAQKSYAAAAAISAADAEGLPKKSNEQLVIDAVRCALCRGDSATADSFLNSAVRNSRNSRVIAYVKLYEQWSALCRSDSIDDLQEPLEILKAYLNVSSLKAIHPVILLTLWYVTGDTSYSAKLVSDFPSSTEAAIVKGDAQLLPTPFWFFVPKSGVAEQGSGTLAGSEPASAPEPETEGSAGFSKWQLGLFRTESNAKLLADELNSKGFAAYISSETRASGTTYYIVLVNENKAGSISDSLRSAGYDCYPVD